MSNIVRIDVTGANSSGAAVNTAKRDVKDLGDEAQKTARRVVELGAAEEGVARGARSMARGLDDAGDEASQLARKLLEATLAGKALGSTDASPHTGKGGGGLLGGMLKDAPKLAVKAGEEAAGTFASAFQGGLMGTFKALPPEAKAALGAGLGAAAIAAAPFIVSAVNGAILGGVGAGGLAAGIAAQFQDPAVSGAFNHMLDGVEKDFMAATKPFKPQLLDVAQSFGGAWDKILPNVQGFFTKLAPAVGKIGEGVAKAMTILGPALERAAGPAEKVLEAVAAEIPEIAQQVGILLDDISEHGDSAAEAIKFILVSVEALIAGFDILVQTVGPAADTIVHMAQAMHLIDAPEITSQLSDLAGTVDDATGTFNGLAEATYNTADAANSLNDAFERMFGEMMSQDEANLKVAEDFRELSSAIKKNGKSLDENTEGGQANRRMLLGMIGDLEAKREADIAAGNGTIEATKKANAAYLQQLEKLRAVAAAAGLPTAAIDALIGKYRQLANMPDITKNINIIHTTTYRTNGTPQAGFSRYPGEAHGGVAGVSWAAAGGPKNGLTWVGEEGPELIQLPPGTSVYTAGQSSRMAGGMYGAGGGGGGGAVEFQVTGDPTSYLYQLVQAGIRERKIIVRQSSLAKG